MWSCVCFDRVGKRTDRNLDGVCSSIIFAFGISPFYYLSILQYHSNPDLSISTFPLTFRTWYFNFPGFVLTLVVPMHNFVPTHVPSVYKDKNKHKTHIKYMYNNRFNISIYSRYYTPYSRVSRTLLHSNTFHRCLTIISPPG